MKNETINKKLEKVKELYQELVAMGSRGSGRHPEGKTESTSVHPHSPEAKVYFQKAR